MVSDINLLYTAGYFKINPRHALSFSYRYFSLGEIIFTDIEGGFLRSGNPFELAFDLGYSLKLGEHLSSGVALRYIHSDLTNGFRQPSQPPAKAGTSLAGDLGFYYQNQFETKNGAVPWAWGINGCASVISASLSTLLAMEMGFDAVIFSGVVLYLSILLVFPFVSIQKKSELH